MLPSKDDSSKDENLEQESEANISEHITCPVCQSAVVVDGSIEKAFKIDPFLQNICQLYDFKHSEERNCDYCRYAGSMVAAVSLCLECHDDMCDGCTDAHRKTKMTRDHKVVPFEQIRNGLYDSNVREYQNVGCQEHDKSPMISFCEVREKLTCKHCDMESNSNNKLSSFEAALPKYQQQMESLRISIANRVPNIEQYVEFLSEYSGSIEETKQQTLSNMENQANTLHTVIDEAKNNMQREINQKCNEEQKMLQSKIANLQIAAKSLKNNSCYLTQLINHGKADEVLALHREITLRLTQLMRMQLDGIEGKLQIAFTPGNSSQQNVDVLFGKMVLDTVPVGKSESNMLVGNGTSGLRITSVLPNVRSKLELVHSFDAEGEKDDKDVWPTGIAITKTNDVIIVDRDNKKVKIYGENGRKKTEFCGKSENKLGTPFDVASLLNGNIAVTDYENEDVKVFTRIGDHVFTIKGFFKHPRGITVNSNGEIIVVDCRLQQISIHDPKNGNLIRKIEGKNDKGSRILVDPYYVTATYDDNIIVTDTAAPNIKVFSAEGKYLAEYGDYGTKEDQILQPYGVCVDDYGYIFVADTNNHRVHLLMPDGRFSKFLLTKADSLWHPMGVAVTRKGYFVVTEALGKVRLYKYI